METEEVKKKVSKLLETWSKFHIRKRLKRLTLQLREETNKRDLTEVNKIETCIQRLYTLSHNTRTKGHSTEIEKTDTEN